MADDKAPADGGKDMQHNPANEPKPDASKVEDTLAPGVPKPQEGGPERPGGAPAPSTGVGTQKK